MMSTQQYKDSASCSLQRSMTCKAAGEGKAAHLLLLFCKFKFLPRQVHQLLRAPAEKVVACRDVPAGRAEMVRLLLRHCTFVRSNIHT